MYQVLLFKFRRHLCKGSINFPQRSSNHGISDDFGHVKSTLEIEGKLKIAFC